MAQSGATNAIEARQGESLTYELDLDQGTPLSNLDWAWSSQNACFC